MISALKGRAVKAQGAALGHRPKKQIEAQAKRLGTPRPGFTLFELILAIALSVALVALIGTAINLYLTRVDASRTQVEESQLARSILGMIADDIRSSAIYKTQDTSALAAMAASGAYDVDDVDDRRSGGQPGDGSEDGGSGDVDDIDAPSGASSGTSSTGGGGASGFGTSSGSSGSSGMSGMGGQSAEPPDTLPLGLSGTIDELYVDVTRLPRREEIFSAYTGYTNAPTAVPTAGAAGGSAAVAATSGMARPSDLKSVRYFIRPGEPVEAGSIAATSLDPALQLRAGGLVRQEIPRTMRVWAEQSGNSMILDSGQALIAPEVVHIEFRYFDGLQVTDVWDMRERGALPLAIEVRLWMAPADTEAAELPGLYDAAFLATAHQYRQTVFLPMSQVPTSDGSSGMSGMGGTSSGSGSGFGSSSGMSSSSSGSGFGEQ